MIKACLVWCTPSINKIKRLTDKVSLKPFLTFFCFSALLVISQSCAVNKNAAKKSKEDPPKKEESNEKKPNKFLDKFDNFNDKAENVFKIIPVPFYRHSTEAGHTFGLAKYNVFNLSKKDSLSSPSRLSGVVSYSTTKRIKITLGGEMLFNKNNYIINGFFNYIRAPELIAGIGNFPTEAMEEQISTDHIKFAGSAKRRIVPFLYAGVEYDFANYFNVKTDSNSYLVQNNVRGLDGGTNIGIGPVLLYDRRDNRYNPRMGQYVRTSLLYYGKSLGSRYEFSKFQIDARKYFNHWRKHVIAIQATTSISSKGAPFYELSLMGGDSQMRGYYLGMYRDNVLIDGQIEYRMPVWKRFGLTVFGGAGRVASSYGKMSFSGVNPNYGVGLRIKVDSKNNTNLRVDFGFGRKGVYGVNVSFSEAF